MRDNKKENSSLRYILDVCAQEDAGRITHCQPVQGYLDPLSVQVYIIVAMVNE